MLQVIQLDLEDQPHIAHPLPERQACIRAALIGGYPWLRAVGHEISTPDGTRSVLIDLRTPR
jgi:hypothetical protein